MLNNKLLLVEDDPNLGDILQEYLIEKGYNVTLCRDGREGLSTFMQKTFDMCILDIMMPIMDGFTLAKKIREVNQQIPIMFLTARGMKEDKIEGFKIGADDYMSKPFSMEELQMRIEAILRRCIAPSSDTTNGSIETFQIGRYQFNTLNRTLTIAPDEPIRLTTKEAELLRMLCLHKNDVMERDLALIAIWGNDGYFTARSMDVFITKLRKHLAKDTNIQIINVHARGYTLIDNTSTPQ